MRGPAGRAGESMNRPREDLPTLRVTNVSEDANEDDLRELFSRFGRVHRVYVGRDRETGIGKGYAFVSFEDKVVAEKAMHRIHGLGGYFAVFPIVRLLTLGYLGYDNLILNCQWSREYYFDF
jgi:translation initiation factor 3 subunit G